NRSVLELLTPGRFFSKGYPTLQRSTYAEEVDREQGLLQNLFISELRYGDGNAPRQSVTIRAESGKLVQRDGLNYLLLQNGVQYQGVPGRADFSQVSFARALMQLGDERVASRPPKVRGWTTAELLSSDRGDARAELHWRISLVLLVPLMCVAAVPLGQVNPRQGRFGKFIPAILLYMFYMGGLLVTRSHMADATASEQSWYLHMGWVHVLVVLAIILIFTAPRLAGAWRARI